MAAAVVQRIVVVADRLQEMFVDRKHVSLHDGRADQTTGRVGRLQEDRGECPRHQIDVVVGRLEEADVRQEVVGVRRCQSVRVVPDCGEQWLEPARVHDDVAAEEH